MVTALNWIAVVAAVIGAAAVVVFFVGPRE
jgi:hypothetical protein